MVDSGRFFGWKSTLCVGPRLFGTCRDIPRFLYRDNCSECANSLEGKKAVRVADDVVLGFSLRMANFSHYVYVRDSSLYWVLLFINDLTVKVEGRIDHLVDTPLHFLLLGAQLNLICLVVGSDYANSQAQAEDDPPN